MCRSVCHPRGISTTNLVVGGVLWLFVLVAVGQTFFLQSPSAANGTSNDQSDGAAAAPADAVLQPQESSVKIGFPARELPDFEFPECMGGTVSRDSLKGHPWIASFVFTRCATTCPMITKEVMELHRRVAESSPDVRFVTFSVDSSYDTADVLKRYAEIYSADHKRWKFLTGDELAIHDLIRRGFTLYVKPNLGEERKPGFEVAHSNRVVLINADSIPVATFLATRPEDMVKLRRILEGRDPFPQPGPALSLTISSGQAAPAEPAQPELNLELRKAEPETPSSSPQSQSLVPEDEQDGASKESAAANPATAAAAGMGDSAPPPGTESANLRIDQLLPAWAARLPAWNALLNGFSTVLLLAGYVSIRGGHRVRHRNFMIAAFGVSVVFLASYLTYHYALGEYTGERGRKFVGSATASIVYKSILVPHVILAVFVPVLALRVFYHAFHERWEQHRRLARITFPVWLFVSVTGVIIYWMLYQWPWRSADGMVS